MGSQSKRSLFRRTLSFVFSRKVMAPVASVALLSGGGWGAYQHFGLGLTAETQSTESTEVAHSAPTAKDELKMLFADEASIATQAKTKPAKTITPEKKATPVPVDRYASYTSTPKLPPLVDAPKPTSIEKTKVETPLGKSVVPVAKSMLGDRYATALNSPTPEPVKPKVEDKKPSPSVSSPTIATPAIARGQEPSGNPLRGASSKPSDAQQEARAAFGAALTQTPKAPAPSMKSNPFSPASPEKTNSLAGALQKARPLGSPPLGLTSNRYQSQPAPAALATKPKVSAAPPMPIQSLPSQDRPNNTAPFAAQIKQSAPLQPSAPPISMPSQRVAQAPAARVNALGAPPVGLSTRSAPSQPASFGGNLTNITPTPGLASHPGTGRPGERLLEGVQSPAITIQKLAPDEIQVGKRCTFAIRVQNSGQRTAQNVQIRDEIPLGTELVGTAPRANVSGAQIVWDLGTLSPGEERTVEMELMPRDEGELGSVATVAFTAQASAKSRCTKPELALRLTSSPEVHVGQQQVVQIEVSNPGTGDATGVMLLETIPAGVSHEAGPALEFEVGTLAAGESKRLELLLTAEQAGKITNVMTARADASLQVEASCNFEIIAPELQLTVEGPQRRFLERPATYRVSVDNPGTASAKGIQLVTHLPKGMQFVSANNLGEYDSSTHSVHWSLAELPANERGTVELIALPIESGQQTLQIATKAEQGLEDRTDKQVLVEGLSALMFEVTDVNGLIEIGDETTYEIRVQNQGSKAATNVQIVAVMPPGIRPMTGRGETRHAIQGERVVFAPLPQLAPKAETTFRIEAQGIRPGDQRVRVQITSDDTQQPITKEVSTRVYADE